MITERARVITSHSAFFISTGIETRQGRSLDFRKIYQTGRRHHVALYEGILNAAGDKIAGHWIIPGDWSGSFLMIRRKVITTLQVTEVGDRAESNC